MEVLGFLTIIFGALVSSVAAFDCPSSGVFGDPLDCTRYYTCDSNLQASKSTCNSNFYFDNFLKNCVQGTCTNPTTTVSTKTSQSSSSGVFTDSTDCRTYHICNFLLDSLRSTCPHLNYFSTTYNGCEVDDCPKTTSVPATTTTTTTTPTSAPVTMTPTSTAASITTSSSTALVTTSSSAAPITTTTIPTTNALPICQYYNQKFPYPSNSCKYYRCFVDLKPIVQQCGLGIGFQHYDVATGNCVAAFRPCVLIVNNTFTTTITSK